MIGKIKTLKRLFLDLIYYRKNKTDSDKALEWVKRNEKDIIKKFIGTRQPASKDETSIAIFMAGSPGAGKTEISKRFIRILSSVGPLGDSIVRIDGDEIRELLPPELYNGANSHVVQRAVSKGVHILFDYVSKRKYNFILDGTFSHFDNARDNVLRLIKKGKVKVEIWYVYQNPECAWSFTKKREALEGRRISKETFVRAFFESQNNVHKIKEEFAGNIELDFIEKNFVHEVEKLKLNVDRVDSYIKKVYTDKNLLDKLK